MKYRLLSEISSHIESMQGAAALAQSKIWELLHCHPDAVDSGAHHDLANVAENLAAVGRQAVSHIEIVRSCQG